MRVTIAGIPPERESIQQAIQGTLERVFPKELPIEVLLNPAGEPHHPLHIEVEQTPARKLSVAAVVAGVCAVQSQQQGWWFHGYHIAHLLECA